MRAETRGALARLGAEEWLGRAALEADPGPYPGDPPGWADWRAADPDGFAGYVRGVAAHALARHARAEAEAAEADQAERAAAAERRSRVIAGVVIAGAAVGLVVVVVVVRRRRRARRRPEVIPARRWRLS
jgi:hypothetical protein